MAQKINFCNPELEPENSQVSNNQDTDNSSVQPLEPFDETETVLEVFKNTLDTGEENPVKRWMEIAAPILKSGGKTVAVILALGFISIPLMVSGSPWVALVLAIGASATAICSCL